MLFQLPRSLLFVTLMAEFALPTPTPLSARQLVKRTNPMLDGSSGDTDIETQQIKDAFSDAI